MSDEQIPGACLSAPGSTRSAPEAASHLRPSGDDPSRGDVYRVRYPFVREKVSLFCEDGPYEVTTWRPGVSIEIYGSEGEYTDVVAHGEGWMILTVVDVFKPGKFPTRVFFTRQFESPDSHVFGKNGLRITTLDAFRRRASGYMHHYDVEDMGAPASAMSARSGETEGLAPEAASAVPKADAHTTPESSHV